VANSVAVSTPLRTAFSVVVMACSFTEVEFTVVEGTEPVEGKHHRLAASILGLHLENGFSTNRRVRAWPSRTNLVL
jgi:hypothetical protein